MVFRDLVTRAGCGQRVSAQLRPRSGLALRSTIETLSSERVFGLSVDSYSLNSASETRFDLDVVFATAEVIGKDLD